MLKISGPVGRGSKNADADVILIQAALKVARGGGFSGAIGSSVSESFFKDLEKFLRDKAPEEGGILRPVGKGIQSLRKALPAQYKELTVYPGSMRLCYVNPGSRVLLRWSEGQYPLPKSETADLRLAINRWDFARKFRLDIADVDTTPDGRFLVRLAFQGAPFLDRKTAKLVALTPHIVSAAREALGLLTKMWETGPGNDITFITKAKWPILTISTETLHDELEMIGLKRVPTNVILRRCANALSRAAYLEELDGDTRTTLTGCFGMAGLQVDAKIVAREMALKGLKERWQNLMIEHAEVVKKLMENAVYFQLSNAQITLAGKAADSMDRENVDQVIRNMPMGDLAGAIFDLMTGERPSDVMMDLLTARDTMGAIANVAELTGKMAISSLARVADAAQLAQATIEVYQRTLKVTKIRLDEIPNLQERRLYHWQEFFRQFEIFTSQVDQIKTLLLGLQAEGSKVPPSAEALPEIWDKVLYKERLLSIYVFMKDEAK